MLGMCHPNASAMPLPFFISFVVKLSLQKWFLARSDFFFLQAATESSKKDGVLQQSCFRCL